MLQAYILKKEKMANQFADAGHIFGLMPKKRHYNLKSYGKIDLNLFFFSE